MRTSAISRTANPAIWVGLQRRRNQQIEQWLSVVDETKRIECPVGITTRDRTNPPRTRAQEVPSGTEGLRIIVVDSDEARDHEERMREKSMSGTRERLQNLAERVAAGKLKRPEKTGAAAERALQNHNGDRYYAWELQQGSFRYFENRAGLVREQQIEGKYVITTGEQDWCV
jgi:hypothetical protein